MEREGKVGQVQVSPRSIRPWTGDACSAPEGLGGSAHPLVRSGTGRGGNFTGRGFEWRAYGAPGGVASEREKQSNLRKNARWNHW